MLFRSDDTKATASYTLKLTEPDQTAPGYVRSVTVLPDTTLGIQTGTFESQFSKPMDTNSTPTLDFYSVLRGETFTYPIPIAGCGFGPPDDPPGNGFVLTDGDKVYIGTPKYAPFGDGINICNNMNAGLGIIDQNGNWTTISNTGFLIGKKDMFDNKYFATMGPYGGGLEELDSNGTWHSFGIPIDQGYQGWVQSLRFDTAGNIYVTRFERNTSYPNPTNTSEFILSPETGTYSTFSGEPLSGSWWTPTVSDNVDQFGNIWSLQRAYGNVNWSALKSFVGLDHAIADNSHWLTSTQYQATYDITSAIPKDTYRVSISDAFDPDGMRVATFSSTTFNVDYAGFISDTTPPTKPVVTASGDGTLTSLSASWSSSDPESPITQYRYAIGTTPGARDVVAWTYVSSATTAMTRSGLNLTYGQPYYLTVGARNEGGLWSEDGVSNGVIAGVAPSPTPTQTFTPSPTATETPTPTQTLTPSPNKIYLPLIIKGQSNPQVVNSVDSSQNWFQRLLARLFNQP